MANTFKRLMVKNLSAALSTVKNYSANSSPATSALLIGITACNTSNNAVSVDFAIYDGSTSYYVIKNGPLPVGGTLVMSDNIKTVLRPGDSIKAKASANSSIDLIVSLMEIT